MDELLLKRKYSRLGNTFFNFGLFFSLLLVVGVLAVFLVALLWALLIVIVIIACVCTLCLILLDKDNRALLGSFFSDSGKYITDIDTIMHAIAIPSCVLAGVFLIASLVFLFLSPKSGKRNTKIVFCFVFIAVSVVMTVLIYTTKASTGS